MVLGKYKFYKKRMADPKDLDFKWFSDRLKKVIDIKIKQFWQTFHSHWVKLNLFHCSSMWLTCIILYFGYLTQMNIQLQLHNDKKSILIWSN